MACCCEKPCQRTTRHWEISAAIRAGAYLSNLLLTVNVALGSSIHKTSDVSARDSHLLILCSLRPQPPFLFLEEGDKLA